MKEEEDGPQEEQNPFDRILETSRQQESQLEMRRIELGYKKKSNDDLER